MSPVIAIDVRLYADHRSCPAFADARVEPPIRRPSAVNIEENLGVIRAVCAVPAMFAMGGKETFRGGEPLPANQLWAIPVVIMGFGSVASLFVAAGLSRYSGCR